MKEIEELMIKNGFECLNHDKSQMFWKADLDVSLDVERYCYKLTTTQIKNFDEKDFENLKWFSMKRMMPQMEIGIATANKEERNKKFPYLEMVPDILIKGFSLRFVLDRNSKNFEKRYNYNFTLKRKFLEKKDAEEYRNFLKLVAEKMNEKQRLQSIFDIEYIPRLMILETQKIIEKTLSQMERVNPLLVLESEFSEFMEQKIKLLVEEYIKERIRDERSDESGRI